MTAYNSKQIEALNLRASFLSKVVLATLYGRTRTERRDPDAAEMLISQLPQVNRTDLEVLFSWVQDPPSWILLDPHVVQNGTDILQIDCLSRILGHWFLQDQELCGEFLLETDTSNLADLLMMAALDWTRAVELYPEKYPAPNAQGKLAKCFTQILDNPSSFDLLDVASAFNIAATWLSVEDAEYYCNNLSLKYQKLAEYLLRTLESKGFANDQGQFYPQRIKLTPEEEYVIRQKQWERSGETFKHLHEILESD